MRMSRSGTLTILALTLGVGLAASHAALASVSTKQVSVTRRGGDPKGGSWRPAASADGRFVAFTSRARDLVQGDQSESEDIFVRDIDTGTTVRASVDARGRDPNEDSAWPSISADGRYVAFYSCASDLVQDDANGAYDVFVRDVVAGTTVRASVDVGDGDSNGASLYPSISADGRYVAFESDSSDLIQGDGNDDLDVFVRDLVAGTTVRASVDTEGGDPNDGSLFPAISPDGRYVAFWTGASDLIQGDGNNLHDVYVHDLVAGTNVRASVDTGSGDSNGGSYGPSISADGRHVAFWSDASDLVGGDGNGVTDVFVRDLVAGITVRASVDVAGGDPDDRSLVPSLSANGRYVAFNSDASDLVPDDGNRRADVFVRDLIAGVTVRVSEDTDGRDSNGDSFNPSLSANGRFVAFWSYASDLVPGMRDRGFDVFLARWS